MAQLGTLLWISENPHTSQQLTSIQKPRSRFRPRKSHTKSKNGCKNCKRRRIKCDEARPSCGQCSDRLLGSVQCEFPVLQKPDAEDSSSLSVKTTIGTIPRTLARDQIISYLEQSGILCRNFKDPIYKPGDALELLNHFLDVTTPWIGSPSFQRIIQQHGLGLSLKAPYMMHAILAFSASHLNYLQPEEKKYSIAFVLHYALSLSSYSLQLTKGFNSSNADATIASSYLHTMLAFKNVESQSNHEIDVDVGGELTWLRAMRGVSILWDTSDMRSHLKGSVLLEMEKNGTCSHGQVHDTDSWGPEISREIYNLFEVDCDPDTFKDSYEGPLNSVCQLMQLGNGQEMICKFMSFVGELPSSFVQLLDQKDPRALLLLCYWSALLGQVDSWWVMGSANVVCRRLCGYLDGIPEQRIHDLLHFPASRCGYIMEDSFRQTTEALLKFQHGSNF